MKKKKTFVLWRKAVPDIFFLASVLPDKHFLYLSNQKIPRYWWAFISIADLLLRKAQSQIYQVFIVITYSKRNREKLLEN